MTGTIRSRSGFSALAFAWGALVAVIASFIINSIVGIVVSIGISPDAGQIAGAVLSAPMFEEGSKGLGLLILLIFFRRYFDDILDGIVFAGVIALGFATVENVLYYGQAFGRGGCRRTGNIVFRSRNFVAVRSRYVYVDDRHRLRHSTESHNTFVRIIAPVIGYFVRFFCTRYGTPGGPCRPRRLPVGYLVLEIPFFLIFVGFAFYIMRRQNKILKEMLAIDIARGLIPKEHGEKAVSAFKSSGWLIGGLFSGKFRPRSRYLRRSENLASATGTSNGRRRPGKPGVSSKIRSCAKRF